MSDIKPTPITVTVDDRDDMARAARNLGGILGGNRDEPVPEGWYLLGYVHCRANDKQMIARKGTGY